MNALYHLSDVRTIRQELIGLHEQAVEFEAAYRDTERARRLMQQRVNRLYQMLGNPAFTPNDLPDEAA